MKERDGDFLKTQKVCTITSVDGAAAPAGWLCQCYDHGGGHETHSYKGPNFASWVAGVQGCSGRQGAHLVVDPTTGMNYCVVSSCN